MDFSFSTHFTLAQSQHSCSCLRAVHLVLSGRKGSALKIRSTRSAMMIGGMTMMSVRRFLNYHVFVSQVTHWYSSRRRERVEEVTEKVSLVHARTHRHTDTQTHTQLDICSTEDDMRVFRSRPFPFLRPSRVAHLALALNTNWQHKPLCMYSGRWQDRKW